MLVNSYNKAASITISALFSNYVCLHSTVAGGFTLCDIADDTLTWSTYVQD